MLRTLATAGLTAALALSSAATFSAQAPKPAPAPTVVLDTDRGQIAIETLPADAPKSVERFLELAKRAFYRGQRFHFEQSNLVQVGDPQSRDMTQIAKWGTGGSGPKFAVRPVGVAETSKRPITRGIVVLAYITGSKPESADCQFIIFKTAMPSLNGTYAVIGRVTQGMAVVDQIKRGDSIKMVTVK